VFIFVAV